MANSFVTQWTPSKPLCPEYFPARILEWVAIPFSTGSSRPRDWTHVSCIGRQILHTEPPGMPRSNRKLIQCMWEWHGGHRSESESRSVVSGSLWPHGLYSPWNSPGQNTGVGTLSLFQGIFQFRDWTQVSRIAGRFFTSWATREAHYTAKHTLNCSESNGWIN